MYRYVLKRLLQIIPVIIGVSFIIYIAMDLAPGDIVALLTPDNATPEQVAEIRAQYGYDRSVFYRYFLYMRSLITGDLGVSYVNGRSVFKTFCERLPATVELAIGSLIVSSVIAIPLGIFSAANNGTWKDNISMGFAMIGLSMPVFWLGLLMIILFSQKLGWFPSSGNTEGLRSLVLPSITCGIYNTAVLTRTTRSSMLDVARQDYLDTARAKGVSERNVTLKHALKNAMIPIITIAGTQVATSLGGSVLTETVFAWPGIGKTIVDAVNQRDVPMVTGCIVLATVLISLVLLGVDLLYALIDPRIKAQYKKGGRR